MLKISTILLNTLYIIQIISLDDFSFVMLHGKVYKDTQKQSQVFYYFKFN